MIELIVTSPNQRSGFGTWAGKNGNEYDIIRIGKRVVMPHSLKATGKKGRHPFNIITEEVLSD